MTYYETWGETQDVFRDPITVTDAPAGVRVVLAEDYDRLREALDAAQEELDKAQEINPSNYGHEGVCDMNRAYCEAYNIIDAALKEAEDER